MLNVVFEVQVRVVLPVERAEAPQHAMGYAVRKRLAKFSGRAIDLAGSGHEPGLVHPFGVLEQVQAGHVHRRFARLEMQESRVQKIDPVHA